MLTFVAFCAISSAGYLLNDLRDREHDRRHPEKRDRPIASGRLLGRDRDRSRRGRSRWQRSRSGSRSTPRSPAWSPSTASITAAYSLVLKRLVIIDVMTIAGLFILRVVAGAVAVGAQASEWLLVCTGMLALFLGFTKRRQEAMLEEPSGGRRDAPGAGALLAALPRPDDRDGHRRGDHQLRDLRGRLAARSAREMLATAPPVLYGIFRYLYLIYDRGDTRSTAEILTERPGHDRRRRRLGGTALLMLYVFD